MRDFPDLPLNEAIRKVTEKTAKQYQKDMAALGCLQPTHEPRATDYIKQMAEMIQTLIEKGHAYVASGKQGREVLFRVGSMKDYGALSNRKLEDQQAGARVAVESHKENPGDFVLWKESSENEPGWAGTFDNAKIHGRPGWHIECSAMAKALLGETFDIHGGGLDLIFPHHENEIAQSCCANDTDKMANVWMHNGFLQVEGKKMSKSDGNFVTVDDVLNTQKVGGRKWPSEVVRLAMLMTHYREPIDFTVRRLEGAETHLKKWAYFFEDWSVEGEGFGDLFGGSPDGSGYGGGDARFSRVLSELCNDLGTPFSLTITHAIDDPLELRKILDILGVDLKNYIKLMKAEKEEKRSTFNVEVQITQRLTHIANKNWPEADRIRDELLAQGIQLKDSKDSETGERVTTWEVKR